jgi:hypothetical protein
MVTDAPDNKNPPRKTIANLLQFGSCEANTKPKAHEKATRADNLNFSNSKYAFALKLNRLYGIAFSTFY